ncbi:FGGY-family carbohydrate kinase [uncultured Roseibium sp.]|uniref:FGGY-family carbohydrate kinase n=1 Tax=uncultured Roseibium sp. TaxID=1936171 RepID=UPI00261D0E3B|nr:FGGY-family carbohydrate kinase [uncultured Roseibium sp.]
MNPEVLIGLDAGTSVIKAVAYDLKGHQIAIAHRRNAYTTLPNGGVVQDMARTWQDTVVVLKELVEQLPGGSASVRALAVTGQGDGTWLIDADGKPVDDGWLWLDARAAETARDLCASDAIDTIYRETATGLNVCQMRTHLVHLARTAPELLKRSAAALHCKDWLYLKMTGITASDVSEAGFTFGSYKEGTYSEDVVDALGLRAYRHLLPPIVDGTRQTHAMTAQAASLIGLPAGLPVCLGSVDVMCCALGAGLHDASADRGMTILGSTGMHMRFVPGAGEVVLNPDMTGYTMPFPGGAFAQIQTNMAATLNIDWALGLMREVLAAAGVEATQADLLARLDDQVLAARPGAAFYLPYISSAGERGPFSEPLARASLSGLDQNTGWFDILRGVFDGLVLASRDCYTALGRIPGEIHLTGGAAKSAALKKLLAAALRAPVKTVAQPEAGAAGAVMMAAVQQGLYPDLTSVTRDWVDPLVEPAEEPDPELADVYDALFPAYLSTRKAMSETWHAQDLARRKLS